MPPIMAVVMAVGFWNPTVKEGAIVSSGLMERPWARYSGTVTGSYNCSGSLSDNYGFVGAVPSGRSIWEYIYPSLQYHYDDSPYIVVQSSQGGKRVYMCSTDPTTTNDNTTVIDDATDIYWRCNSGTTYSPTSLGPTPAPTLNPTLAPTTGDEDEFYALYGPSSKEECDDNGGVHWNGGILYDDVDRDAPDAYVINMTYGNTVVRYCCGVPACVGAYYHDDANDGVTQGCACNPTPWEVQVRNNGGGMLLLSRVGAVPRTGLLRGHPPVQPTNPLVVHRRRSDGVLTGDKPPDGGTDSPARGAPLLDLRIGNLHERPQPNGMVHGGQVLL